LFRWLRWNKYFAVAVEELERYLQYFRAIFWGMYVTANPMCGKKLSSEFISGKKINTKCFKD